MRGEWEIEGEGKKEKYAANVLNEKKVKERK